uniref:Trimeric dUTP diphosphatase n=1 Tax=Marseillevirus LCMAC102 TaxID=2506603 RepID=A0A481YTG9_9VIRU|nr:MAG: trimeric dUTP diphosphatase [Marseillevirus LCMAC102]
MYVGKKRSTPNFKFIDGKINVYKTHPSAEFPFKENPSNIGYGVTLISRTENRAEDDTSDVNNFHTGIAISPPIDYYIEVIAKPSLHKHGYILANGVLVIEPDDKGELIIPLYKFKEAEDLELPFCGVQLMVRPAVHAHISSVTSPTQSEERNMTSFQPERHAPDQYPQNAPQYKSAKQNHMF